MTEEGSNTAEQIAELRREVRRQKGIAERAAATSADLRHKEGVAWGAMRRAQAAIKAMGGIVRD